jgi:hypothetical protein
MVLLQFKSIYRGFKVVERLVEVADFPMEVGVVAISIALFVAKLIMLWIVVGRNMVTLLIYNTYSKMVWLITV